MPTGLSSVPLFFEASPSMAPQQFLARTREAQFLIGPTEVQLALRQRIEGDPAPAEIGTTVELGGAQNPVPPPGLRSAWRRPAGPTVARFARLTFVDANTEARMDGLDSMPGKINYFIGNDPARWQTGLPTCSRVRVRDLYRGIDLVYYGNQRQLEYDYTIAPGTDPARIVMRFEGVDKISVNAEGELVLQLAGGEIREHRPILYQVDRGVRREIAGGYQIVDSRTVRFNVGTYNHKLPLTIDPIFEYSTYFGGNANDSVLGIKVDLNGGIYIAGETLSTQFPFAVPTNAFQRSFKGGTANGDAFIAKLDNTATKLLYFTYLGSSGEDGALDLAIDGAGNAYVTGFTDAADFPVRNALFPHVGGTPDPNIGVYYNDAFVAELNTNGSALVFSTYLGGSNTDIGSAITVDQAGFVYVAGLTYSFDFPVTTHAFQPALAGTDDAFVAKISPGGRNLVYATYLGGLGTDEGEGIAADSQGSAYVTGYTISSGFPVTPNAWQTNFDNNTNGFTGYDAFVTKLGPYGSNLVYSTYLGGTNGDFGYRITLDSLNNAYVTGTTFSPDFPNTGPVYGLRPGINSTNLGNYDAFLTRLNPSGRVVFSTFFGGAGTDYGWDVAVDPTGHAFVIGVSISTDFPVTDVSGLLSATNSGGRDAFITAFNTNGLAVRYSGYLGGSFDDYGYGVAVDSESSAYLTGVTYSTNFPTLSPSFQSFNRGGSDAFLAKIRLQDPVLNVTHSGNTLVFTWPATAGQYVLQAANSLVPPITWVTVPVTPVLSQGVYTVSLVPTNGYSFFRLHRP